MKHNKGDLIVGKRLYNLGEIGVVTKITKETEYNKIHIQYNKIHIRFLTNNSTLVPDQSWIEDYMFDEYYDFLYQGG